MSDFINKIIEVHKSEKNDHLILAVNSTASSAPQSVYATIEGGFFTRLGMIEMAIRQLEEMREDMISKAESHGVAGKSDSPKEEFLKERLEKSLSKLPDHMQTPIRNLMDKMLHDIQENKTQDVKQAFTEDVLKQINKRFGFEGNSLDVENM